VKQFNDFYYYKYTVDKLYIIYSYRDRPFNFEGELLSKRLMRQQKELIKNIDFIKMARSEFKVHPQKMIGWKRWLIKYWDDLLEAHYI